jgi:hypothetical protein
LAAVLVIAMLGTACAAQGAQRWASPTGTGPAGTCPQANPCDIDTAVEDASVVDGDEVVVTPGTYNIVGLNVSDAIDLHAQALQPRPLINSSSGTAVTVNDAATVSDLRIEAAGQGGIAGFGDGATIQRVSVHAASAGGVACIVASAVTIRDSTCWAVATNSSGLGANSSTSPGAMTTMHLRNVTAVGSVGGLTFGWGFGDLVVDAKNVIAKGGASFPSADVRASASQGGSVQVNLASSNYATEFENVSSGSTVAAVTDPGTGTNQTAAPVFVNAGAGDFHQAAGSPTIDAGVLDGFTGTGDFDGDARTLEGDGVCPTAPDIGADEFIGAGPIDCDPPETTISGGPTGVTNDATPTFNLLSDELNSTFECKLDAGPFAPCSNPFTSSALADGPHVLQVRAIDQALNVDPTPDTRAFTVDTSAPETSIPSGPAGMTADATPTFGLASDEAGSTFECKLDSGAFSPCTSPHTTAPLADGDHTLQVRATDQAGNSDATPASRAFEVDTTAPETTITAAPKAKVKTKHKTVKVSLSFSSNEPGRFECKLDSEDFAPCTSPLTRTVGKGTHTWSVRAFDALDQVDATPADTTFKVKRKRKRR